MPDATSFTRKQRELSSVGMLYSMLGWLLAVAGGLAAIVKLGNWTEMATAGIVVLLGLLGRYYGNNLRRLEASGWWGCLVMSVIMAPVVVPVLLLVVLIGRRDQIGTAMPAGGLVAQS